MPRKDRDFAKRVGKAIAAQRLAKGLTQEQVAFALDVETESISRFERGAVLPPLGRLVELADVFGVPVEYLIRSGSTRALDQAMEIADSLGRLSPEDRSWVSTWVNEICAKLAVTSSKQK
jgi:transcriptional regulator with XRE-family HTH domain